MKTLLLALVAFALLTGCSSVPSSTAQIDGDYLYGTWAGTPQRPTLMD